MIAVAASVFLASVLGSLHCAGMCGAFVAFAVAPGPGPARGPSRSALHAAYNGGRLMTYVALGALAGAVGGAVDLGGSLVGAQRIAGALSAAVVATFGVLTLLRALGVRTPAPPAPAWLHRAVGAGHRRAAALPPIGRALAVGLLTTLLPCGWLYAFVATAAGTASPVAGAALMAVFWLGTLPALVAVGSAARAATGRLGRVTPVLAPVLVTVVALGAIAWRAGAPEGAHHDHPAARSVNAPAYCPPKDSLP